MVNFIDNNDLGENTLIIFTSDHGSFLYDHGVDNDKHGFMDASFQVPLIMRMTNKLPSNVTRSFAGTVDVTATVLGAAGVKKTDIIGYGDDANTTNFFMSGFDLFTPLLDDANSAVLPRTAVASTEYRGYAVVTTKYKLMYFTEQNEVKLFNRVNDKDEINDLSGVNEYKEVKMTLLLGLLRWRSQQDDLQWAMENWSSAAEVGIRARDDSAVLNGLVGEVNLQEAAKVADSLEIMKLR